MATVEETGKTTRKRRRMDRAARNIGGCALLVVIGIGTLIGVYQFNNRTPDIVIPTPTLPVINGYDDFLRASKLASAMPHISPVSMPGPAAQTQTYQNFKDAAHDAEPMMVAVRQGLQKPYMAPPVRSFKPDMFPDYAGVRNVARAILGKAHYEEISDQPAKAMETRLDGYEMGVTFPRGGSLITGLVGIAIEAISIKDIEPQLSKLNERELAHVAARLDRIAARRAAYADILQEDSNTSLAQQIEMLRDPKNRGLRAINWHDVFGSNGTESLPWKERAALVASLFANKTAMLKRQQAYYQMLVAEARRPYNGRSRVATPNSDIELKILAEAIAPAREKFLGMETVTTVLQTETALERYQRAHGRYPATLAELVPAYMKTVPIDICTGSASLPLRYATQNDGQAYLLYSVGLDMRDDGGIPQKFVNTNDGKPGDIVAHRLWPNRKPFPVPMPKQK
jgi:hypothetical protein